MSIRQFKLKSGSSELDLTVKGGAFLSSPTGLGYSVNNTYLNIGNSYALSKSKPKQGEVSCTMVFADYEQYVTFVRFCTGTDNLILCYRYPVTNGYSDWFYREVELANCDKGEIGEGNVLQCSTKFTCRCNWYKDTTYTGTVTTGTTQNSLDFSSIQNNGDVDAGYELVITGNGATITSIDIEKGNEPISTVTYPFQNSATLSNADYVLNTVDTHAALYLTIGGTSRADITPGYSQNTFCKLPKTRGTTSTDSLSVSFTGTSTLTATLTVREEYITV